MPKLPTRFQRIGIVYNAEKERAYTEYLHLKSWLEKRGIKALGAPRVGVSMRSTQLVVALGGDGTVLSTARAVAPWGIPVLGVNLGRLGFLAATEAQSMFRTMSHVLAGDCRLESRTMIAISGHARGKAIPRQLALNDCVLRSGSTGRVVCLRATVQHQLLANYVGDGLIVATPTGSTAYNLAVSGPIVYPDIDALIISPISPHSLAQRPLIVPTFEIISVEVHGPNPTALLCIDGTVVETLRSGDHVEIRRAPEQVLLLRDPQKSFYQVLQQKLKWGGG